MVFPLLPWWSAQPRSPMVPASTGAEWAAWETGQVMAATCLLLPISWGLFPCGSGEGQRRGHEPWA